MNEKQYVAIKIVGTKRDIQVLLTALKDYEKSDKISKSNRYTAQDLISLISNQANIK